MRRDFASFVEPVPKARHDTELDLARRGLHAALGEVYT